MVPPHHNISSNASFSNTNLIVQMFSHYSPITVTELDRLFEDAPVPQICPCASTLKAGQAKSFDHSNVYRPRLDLYESVDGNTVTATFELPGLTSESVAIDVRQNCLTVSGESAAPDSEKEDYFIRERPSGKFSRTLRLPLAIKLEDVSAKMENGILTITFPKISPEPQARRIPIQ